MGSHPYSNLPETRFWSSGVKSPAIAQTPLAVEPLLDSLSRSDTVVSGGSCFAQYIGQELTSRHFHYLRSQLSDDRVESFGLGNIYTIAQLKQWLEFALDQRLWDEQSLVEVQGQWHDYLLPHRNASPSRKDILAHRLAIKEEILSYLSRASVFVFTLGLTETWTNPAGDVYPVCPGTLVGEYDENRHVFHNSTFDEILADLQLVEALLSEINPDLRLIYTVSPVPLTATASDTHVLMATSYSKAVIRAAVGQHCQQSDKARYFPSYELINHPVPTDWRFSDNLRSISTAGVEYVMSHAFASDNQTPGKAEKGRLWVEENANTEAVCEEQLLDSYSKLPERSTRSSSLVLVGDSHMGNLATAFEANAIAATGGMVMNGSGFSEGLFDLSDEHIFTPLENEKSQKIWFDIHDKLIPVKGHCNIITNIGLQTHRTIATICNHFRTPVLTEEDIALYHDTHHVRQMEILQRLTAYGTVWLVEDPNFFSFLESSNDTVKIVGRNFHAYISHIRKVTAALGIKHLAPCDSVLSDWFKQHGTLAEAIGSDGSHGTAAYYEKCATYIHSALGCDTEDGHPQQPATPLLRLAHSTSTRGIQDIIRSRSADRSEMPSPASMKS